MYPKVRPNQVTTESSGSGAKTKEHVRPPRVKKTKAKSPKVNEYRPKYKQKFRLGTRVKVVEGKKEIYYGTARKYDPDRGMYEVEFDDGEWDDFDEGEMEDFLLVKPHKPRAPSTASNTHGQWILP